MMATYIAIDLGLKRIGLALSYGNGLVTPLSAIERKNRNQAANDVKKVLNEYEVTTVVIGIPMGSTTEDEMRRRVAHFMNLVEFSGEIAYQDEEVKIGDGNIGKITQKLYDTLTGIQFGKLPDPFGWITRL